MSYINPDTEWYENISKEKLLPLRCPHANVHKCPRYYASLYLLGETGITTKISKEKTVKLDQLWDESDLLPVIAEHDAGISYSDGVVHNITNFCPEVTHEIYGLFASSLYRYSDEIDKDYAHQQLEKHSEKNDWRWVWSSLAEMHFSGCPVYFQVNNKLPQTKSQVSEEDVLLLKPSFFGVGINLKSLYNKITQWKKRI